MHLGKLDRDPQSIKSWMQRTALPSLINFSNEFVEPVFKRGLPSLILYTNDSNDERAAYSNVFKEASDALSNEIMFVRTGCQKGIQKRLCEMSLVTEEQMPYIQVLKPGKEMRRFKYSASAVEDITVSSIKTFVDDFNAGKLKPDLRSAPEPVQDADAYTLVGSSWDRVVMDPAKDVFVFYYAPYCQQCAEFAPEWDALARSVKSNSNIVVAKMNLDQNEIEQEVLKFPTIMLYSKENKKGIDYSAKSGLTEAAFKKFLLEHSSEYRALVDGHVKTEDL